MYGWWQTDTDFPDLNLERVITKFSDWADPTSPGGGCVVTPTSITYELNYTYKVSGQQGVGNREVISNGKNMAYGTSNSDGLFRTGIGPLFKVNSGDTFFINLLKCSGDGTATMWDATGSGSPLEQILVVASEISGFASLGTQNSMGVFRFESNFFIDIADGFAMGGTGLLISFINNDISIDSNIFLDLGTCIYSSITYRGHDFAFSDAGAAMISGLSNSGNIAVGGFGQLLNNTFLGDGDYISGGLENDDLRWNYKGNLGGKGTDDSRVVGSLIMENNTTATTITDIGETFTVTAYADAGGGSTEVTTSVVHGLANGVAVWIVRTVAYDGQYVTANVTPLTFDIIIAFKTNEATGVAETGWATILGTTTTNITRRIIQSANSQITYNNIELSNSSLDAICGVGLSGGGARQVQTAIFKNNARCLGSLGSATTGSNIAPTHSKCLAAVITGDICNVRVRNLETTTSIIVENESFTTNE